MEQKLYDAASRLPETSLAFDEIQPAPKATPVNRTWRTAASLAACLLLLIAVGFGATACAAEVKEYNDAIRFFNEYGLSADGLSRGEIKAVYRDITTKSFTYSKTAEVIENSLSTQQVGGYEILQEDPSPEEVETLWNYKNANGSFIAAKQEGIHYRFYDTYKPDNQLDIPVLNKSFLEKYDGDTLIWSICVTEFSINGYSIVSDGIIAYGETDTRSSLQNSYAWMAKIDTNGSLLWERMLSHGFEDEYIAAVLENDDGSYAVISRGDFKYFCLSQYTRDGEQTHFQETNVGNYGIWNAARFDNGYIVQLGSYMTNEHAKLVKVDRDGNITDSFSYSGEDAYYYLTDMIEFDGNIYLSAYAVPRLADETQSAGSRYEIAAVLDYLFDHNIWEISSEKLTPMVRDNYTAMLLVCDPSAGTPQEFFSVKGSLGGSLSLSESGKLLWDVESITSTYFSPATSSFTIGGTCCVFRYSFDDAGTLITQEKTGEVTDYRR